MRIRSLLTDLFTIQPRNIGQITFDFENVDSKLGLNCTER